MMLKASDAIIVCICALLGVGVLMVNSALMSVAPDRVVTIQSVLLSRPAMFAVLAALALVVASRAPLAWLTSPKIRWAMGFPLLAAILALLAMVYLPGIGREVNGSRRWINLGLGGLGMQPSEFAKWGTIFVLAVYGVSRGQHMNSFVRGLAPGLGLLGLVSGLIAIEDLGTGVLIAAVGCTILLGAGAKFWQFLAMTPIAIAGMAFAIWSNPYRLDRITSFLHPFRDPQGDGYHMIQSLVAIAGGEGFGRGLGFGLQKFGYLPEDETDFLFSVICEEFGIAGAGMVAGLYLVVIWLGVSIVSRQRDPLLKLIGLGITATFGLQALINLFVVTGMAPTKGIALPLISNGGTGWILTAGSLGLLAAMDRLAHAEARAPLPVGAAEPRVDPDQLPTHPATAV